MSVLKSLAEKRASSNKKRSIAMLKKFLSTIEEVKKLEEEGRKEEADALLDSAEADILSIIEEIDKKNGKIPEGEPDRSKIPDTGEILAENELVVLKMIDLSEYDSYIDVSYECSLFKDKYIDETYKKSQWESFLVDHSVVTSIYDKHTGDYVGYCSVKDIRAKDWEIAIEEKMDYRGKGYGYNAISLLVDKLTELTGQRFYRAVIDIDNFASQNLFKKLGAYPDGISEFLLHGKELEEFQKENLDVIDDNIRRVADEFCTDPEDLIGHVLEYRIDAFNKTKL